MSTWNALVLFYRNFCNKSRMQINSHTYNNNYPQEKNIPKSILEGPFCNLALLASKYFMSTLFSTWELGPAAFNWPFSIYIFVLFILHLFVASSIIKISFVTYIVLNKSLRCFYEKVVHCDNCILGIF